VYIKLRNNNRLLCLFLWDFHLLLSNSPPLIEAVLSNNVIMCLLTGSLHNGFTYKRKQNQISD
jgi:hypothetical protein